VSNKEYEYSFITNDQDGDDVSYYIDWDDGSTPSWTSFQSSGTTYFEIHTWRIKGTYVIRAKTKDIYGTESDWTEFELSMPKTKTIKNPILRFLQNHPNLFPFLRLFLNIHHYNKIMLGSS
jgi:hypothetical protein